MKSQKGTKEEMKNSLFHFFLWWNFFLFFYLYLQQKIGRSKQVPWIDSSLIYSIPTNEKENNFGLIIRVTIMKTKFVVPC